MRKILYLVGIITLWAGCSLREEGVSFDSGLMLVFSADTVAFDTLLSETRSSTQRLTVYNPNDQAIQFSSIYLGLASDSEYSIIVNGKEGPTISDEIIFGGDSLLILVEANLESRNNDNPYLVKDSIVFDWNGNEAHVKLVTYGQDGNRIQNQTICDEVWTNNRPYVISDTLLVEPNCNLTIEAGTRVYFENDAVIFIQGSLTAIGDSANHIEFRNARFDGVYDEVPGQWNGIYFLEGSSNNQIAYTDIFNAQVGLRIGTPDDDDVADVSVSNTTIFNMSVAGILAFTSDVEVVNSLIYNCGTYLVGNFAGGNYNYQHCTFSNDPSLFVLDEPTVQFSDNVVVGENELITADLSVTLANCIVWGTSDEELLINSGGGAAVEVLLVTNIIRTSSEIENNFTSTDFNFPGFRDPFSFDYSLDTLAFAKDKGTDLSILHDIKGKERDDQPDIGAFERIENE